MASKKIQNKQRFNNDAIAKVAAERIISLQRRTADCLNKRTAGFTKIQKQILLLIISIVFSSISLYLILKSIL